MSQVNTDCNFDYTGMSGQDVSEFVAYVNAHHGEEFAYDAVADAIAQGYSIDYVGSITVSTVGY